MNRRDFIGSVIGGIAMAKLGVADSFENGMESVEEKTVPKLSWIDNGLIDAGGSHEPYMFIVRRGGQSVNARQVFDHEQSEEVIRELFNQGVEVFHTHLYKGFGMAAEKAEMEETARTAALVHRLGMRVDTYIQWGSMMNETFFAEEPRAPGWIQRDAFGQPILLEYGYQQSYRYMPCFSNQEYIDYLKKVVRYALLEVKTDFIHFDNFGWSPEPYSCHCESCKAGFRKFLRNKYSPEQRKERFGFEIVDYINPPLWNSSNRPGELAIISDPAFQEWIDYRCETMADALSQMAELIRSVNHEVVVEINCGGVTGDNTAWTGGTDHSRLLKLTKVFWDESDSQPEYLPDGRLITSIRTYKTARTYRNIALASYTPSSEVAMAESLAFNQTIGFAGVSPLSAEMLKYISFYKQHRDKYVGSQDVASVAVLRSFPSIAYNNSGAGLSALLVEQALIQSKIPFHLIFDEHLSHLSPATCKALILPNSECLSDEQIASIRRYVEAGGGLVAAQQAGLYDSWRRRRVKPGLEGLVDDGALAGDLRKEAGAAAISASTRKECGKGRAVYLREIEFDGALPPSEPYFVLGTEFWKRPKNWEDLLDAVYWAAREDIPMRVSGPAFLGANLVEQREKRRRLVHLVNYNSSIPFVENIEVHCVIPEEKAASVMLYSPNREVAGALDCRMESYQARFTVPRFSTYCMVTVSW
jgi:hypothetical protein